MKALASILFLFLIFLQLQLWFSSYGVFQLWSMHNMIDQQVLENNHAEARNEQLHAEVQELKKGQEALEERARSQLGLIREGETFYRIIPQRKNTQEPSPTTTVKD